MATRSQWLLLGFVGTWLGFCTAWMDERPVLESRDGNLFISAAKDRNITLKTLGNGYVNVNEINLLHVATAAQSATRLIERWKTGYLAEVESNLQRLTQIVEGPDGLEKRIATMRGFEGNTTQQSEIFSINQTASVVNMKIRMLHHRILQVENKVKSIERKLRINECASNPCMNGGTCYDLYEGYECHCPSNWEGPNCMADVNECVRLLGTDLGCQNGATCRNLPGSYKCECAAGYYGLHCKKKSSVCNTQNSNELCGHGICVSKLGTPLGYTCICDQGWQSEGTNPACIKDVDECAGNHRPCSVNPWVACRNAPGTFFCDSCPRGYTGNGYYCADIDECQVNNGGCSTSPLVQCINTMGSRMCGACPTGYRGDGVTCVYVGSCAINNGGCHPLATCVENSALTSAYVICRCPPGTAGDGIGPNGCQSSTEASPCSNNPCVHGKCAAVSGTYSCTCDPGYTGATCNVKIDPCSPNPCKNNGVCTISNGAATCDCPSTYTGTRCETPRQTCGGVSRNPVGHLEFPIGGNVYQHGLSCAWVLITNSSLVLNVTFTRFNLEHSTDCKYDFLQIHDGRNAGSQMIGRFCGQEFPYENKNIVSSHNSLYFWFHSDNSVSYDGFAFEWNSVKPICGGSLTNDYGTISSPGSPGRYPPNRDCYWQITVKSGKRIQIHFGQLMLEEHRTCGADFLEISTIHGERLGLYCNHSHPAPLIVPASSVVIYFHSDGAGQDSGFQIHYSAIQGRPGCNEVYTSPSGIIRSPMSAEQWEELECEWKIQLSVGKRIQIFWTTFELLKNNCHMEYVEIYDGETSESPLIQRYCGSSIPPSITSNSNVLLIIFKSYAYQIGAFSLSYKTICGKIFTEVSGIIQSPTYPLLEVTKQVCTYEIRQPPNRKIVLKILDIDINNSLRRKCIFNYLDVFDGPNENSTRLANLCKTAIDLTYYSTHNVMTLKYSGATGKRGFMANYTTTEIGCGGLFTERSGTIQSPSNEGRYRNNENCIWTIQAPIGHVIHLSWLSFNLENNRNCPHDYVKIYENFMSSNQEIIGTFCGTKHPPTIISQVNDMTLIFHSDSSIINEGFIASYMFVDASKVCGGHFVKPIGVIKSPNYPNRYPRGRECVWVIEAANKQRVIINVEKFNLERHTTCGTDYLEIRNGGYETSPLIGKFCGTDIPSEIISQTNQLYLKFVSRSRMSYPGFSIRWDSTTVGCGGSLTAAQGDIISPNYPMPYMHQAECYWRIAVAEGSLVRLIILDLELEHHNKCRYDYIEISEGMNRRNSERFCGKSSAKIIQRASNILNIKFHSDFTNSGRGFHLKYETLCQNITIHNYYGIIESPNFPYKYEHNLNCSWMIDAPIGNKINLTFSHFDVEGLGRNNSCEYDYLDISEGMDKTPSKQLAKLCNSDVLPAKIHSSQHQVFLKFITDSFIAFNGFRLEWIVDGCGGHLTRPFDTFTSPGYPSSYPTDIECEWLIEVDYGHSIELTLHDIKIEKKIKCYFDKLQIYGGENEQAPLLVEICYSSKPVVYTSFGNTMFLKFLSDVTYVSRGFNASYKTVPITCGGRFTSDSGIIHSANYPQNYPNKQNCKWLFQVDQNYVVNITFLDFDIENTENCTDDYVRIYDGPTTDSPILGTHCRNQLPPSYVSTSNEMLLVMRTDSLISAKGFKAQYRKACGARIIVKDQGYIVPYETYIGNSDYSENCTWTLIAENLDDHVTVTFTHMDYVDELDYLQFWSRDCFNYIEVFDGVDTTGPSRGKWCNKIVPLPITSNGNALTVHLYKFHENSIHFSLAYSVLNSACGGNYTAYHGEIASPNYPNSYPLNSECIWILENSPGNKISLSFSQFNLQQSEDCNLDYVEIREESGIGKLISISCGTSVEPVESSKPLWIKFKSDGDGVATGFRAEFSVMGGNELSGPSGKVTSPLYPIPYKGRDTLSWRITVEFQWAVRIQFTDIFIENSDTYCFSYFRVYDGYDSNAPILLEICDLDIPDPITSSTNVIYIDFSVDILRQGSWFELNWIQVPIVNDDNGENIFKKLSECNMIVEVQNYTYDFTSPGWPHGYDTFLRCNWVFLSPPGTHLKLRILTMDLEETAECTDDFVAVYSGNALTDESNANLLRKLCLANSTLVDVEVDNVMTVKFETDGYRNNTGFSAFVSKECGGKMEGPNGVIEVNETTTWSKRWLRRLQYKVNCEWVVKVRPGRTIEAKIVSMSIQKGPNWTCTNNYLMLKNGGDSSSPLLGSGKYCGDVTPPSFKTIGNLLYVKTEGFRDNINFKLTYREVSMNCGGEFHLSNKQKEWEISTPNYPNIPPPYSECVWTVMAPGKERIFIHFIERFDLSNTINCEKEYVEIRDGGTEKSNLLGRFCKDVAPSSMMSTGNMMRIHYFSDLSEPKNGFKALLSIKHICGGIIRDVNGVISSPNFPFFYPKNQTCTWWITAPAHHTLKFTFLDINLPGLRRCKITDHVQIDDVFKNWNDTSVKRTEIGTYCGMTIPDPIETATNEAVITFQSDNFEYAVYKGFSISFNASNEICGGELTAIQGTIKSNGYPNIATRSRYCDWRIKLPRGYHVVIDVQDLPEYQENSPLYYLTFYNDFNFKSKIKILRPNSTTKRVTSSGNTMMIGAYTSSGYRGFKLRYFAEAPAPCGGEINEMKGNLSAPRELPFNESSYFCQWIIKPPESLLSNNNTGVTLSIMVTGVIGGIRGLAFTKLCFNNQYISLKGIGMLCGNFTEPTYLRSPELVNELNIVNGTYGTSMRFTLEYKWQRCGGIFHGMSHVIKAPKNVSYPINCVWHAKYPNNEIIRLHFNQLHLGSCDKNYLSIRNGGPFSPEIGKFCENSQSYNFTSTFNEMWIEFVAIEEPTDFEFTLEPANNGCGGALRGDSREISSPNFPSAYPNNAECTWEITADNGYSIGLVFVDRYHLESSTNCEKDYVQIFNWIKETGESSAGTWKDLGKVCGRHTPLPFNSTSNRMKVVFHSNEAIQGDGFRAVWFENCGGIFDVTAHPKVIVSPSYPISYPPNLFCNYTLVAPGKDILVKFMDFQIERSRRGCRYDNVTIKYQDGYMNEENTWCGEDKPPLIRASNAVEIIFRTDNYLARSGFKFKYFLHECGGLLTTPGEIKPLMNGNQYFGRLDCTWKIQAPSDKSVVLRFESFDIEFNFNCIFDNLQIYNGSETLDENKIAVLCGNLTDNLPVIKSNSNSMVLKFHADDSRHSAGFSLKVQFVKSISAGCGGNINLSSTSSQSFKTQTGSTYDSLEDCHWIVSAAEGKNIKFTINSMDVRNSTNRTGNGCTGDYIEIRDGAGPFSELLGRYCGNRPPPPILSSSNSLLIRFYSDGTVEGAGVSGTLETVDALCTYVSPIINGSGNILTSPNYPNNYEPGTKCRWTIKFVHYFERMRIKFLDFDLADSRECKDDFLQITDKENRKYIEQGLGQDLVWSGNSGKSYYLNEFMPKTAYKYCGNSLPHDYYSYSTEFDLTFNGIKPGHKGFKLEYSKATCDRNFTELQGRIVHEGIDDCWITITVPENHTISLYFNQFMLYDQTDCTKAGLNVFDGDFHGKLMASLCSIDTPSPIFSTGNKLSLRSWSEWHSSYEYYDITYTTTNAGRGCGGKIFNYAGSFTSPMYPNEYRNNTICIWDVNVPRGLKVVLTFTVLDIGSKSTCNYDYNIVSIYDVTSDGTEEFATSYCGGDDPAPFIATSNRLIVKYISSVNNIGTGWRAIFEGRNN